MPDSIHNWDIDPCRNVVTDLCYSPDDGGWYGHQVDLKNHRTRNTKRLHIARSSLEFDLSAIGALQDRKLWERWS